MNRKWKIVPVVLMMQASILLAVFGGAGQFVDALDEEWAQQDYSNCLSIINSQLSTNASYLPALVAKACYYVFVDADFEAATGIFATASILIDNLSATNQDKIVQVYEGIRDDVVACLSVPMTNSPTETEKQYVRDQLYPTNYPEQNLLRMLDP